MDITEKIENEIVVLEIDGRLDTSNYGKLEKKLGEVFDNNKRHILINLDKMDYVSSSGLRVFLMYLKKLKANDGKLMLSNMQDTVKDIFNIAGFTSIFEIYDSPSDAKK